MSIENAETEPTKEQVQKDSLTGLEDEILQKKKKGPIKLVFTIIAVSLFFAGFNLALYFDTVLLKNYLCSPQVFHCAIKSGNFVESNNLSSASTGLIIIKGSGALFFMISLIAGGAYSDDLRTRFGNRVPMILIGAIISGLGYFLLPIIVIGNSFVLVMILGIIDYAIIYTGMGIALAPEYALISELFTKEERGLAGLGFAGIGLIGTVAGIAIDTTLVSPVTFESINWYLVGLTAGLIMVLLGLLTFIFTPKYNPPFPGDGTMKDILATPKYLFQMGSGAESNRDFLLMFIVGILWGGGGYLISLGFPDYVQNLAGKYPVTIDKMQLLIILGISAAIFAGPVGIVITKLGKIKSGIAGSLMLGAFTFIIGQTFARNNTPIILLSLLAGVGIIFISAINISLPADLVPRGKEGQFMGLFNVAANVMAPLIGPVAGIIVTDGGGISGWATVFLLTTVLYFGAVIILSFMHYEDQLEGEYQMYYRRYLIFKGFVSDKAKFTALKVSSSLKIKKSR